jgi:hypothetical protein
MKEMKVRVDEALLSRLRSTAKKQVRCITGQITLYIVQGLEADERALREACARPGGDDDGRPELEH